MEQFVFLMHPISFPLNICTKIFHSGMSKQDSILTSSVKALDQLNRRDSDSEGNQNIISDSIAPHTSANSTKTSSSVCVYACMCAHALHTYVCIQVCGICMCTYSRVHTCVSAHQSFLLIIFCLSFWKQGFLLSLEFKSA